MGRVFGRECDAYISVRANEGEPFFFFYRTVFNRITQRLPFSSFEKELLTEINVATAQLHLMDFQGALLGCLWKMVRKLMEEMNKVLLRGVVTLKVHEECGHGEVRPAPL